MKEEILFLTHKKNENIKKAIREIRDQMGDRSLTIISQSIPFNIKGTDLFLFEESIVDEMDFPTVSNSIVPGNAYFPVFSYIEKQNKPADYYWLIEYDVRFSGDWSVLFDHFQQKKADLIASHIQYYHKEPEWYWWEINHPQEQIPKKERIRSFCPIYRISHEAYLFLKQKLESGWKGHYETTFPTLLYHSDYQLLDFGGNGDFSAQQNQFYISRSDRSGHLYTGTMRYRPATKKQGLRKNKLYHPVKENGMGFLRFYTGNFYRLIKLWVRKAGNRNSSEIKP